MPEIKLALDRGEDDDAKEEDDPDAIDETVSNYLDHIKLVINRMYHYC